MSRPRLLIVYYHYFPSGEVGAKRPSETAMMLARAGFDITVIRGVGYVLDGDGLSMERVLCELYDRYVVSNETFAQTSHSLGRFIREAQTRKFADLIVRVVRQRKSAETLAGRRQGMNPH